jgi:hypothetical protein
VRQLGVALYVVRYKKDICLVFISKPQSKQQIRECLSFTGGLDETEIQGDRVCRGKTLCYQPSTGRNCEGPRSDGIFFCFQQHELGLLTRLLPQENTRLDITLHISLKKPIVYVRCHACVFIVPIRYMTW